MSFATTNISPVASYGTSADPRRASRFELMTDKLGWTGGIAGKTSSAELADKVKRMARTHAKLLQHMEELAAEMDVWLDMIPNAGCRRSLLCIISALRKNVTSERELLEKQEEIRTQLIHVNKREKKVLEVRGRWLKLSKALKTAESKSLSRHLPSVVLVKEELEEAEGTAEVIEDQYLRSINDGLRLSFLEYFLAVRNSSAWNLRTCDHLMEKLGIEMMTGEQERQQGEFQEDVPEAEMRQPAAPQTEQSFVRRISGRILSLGRVGSRFHGINGGTTEGTHSSQYLSPKKTRASRLVVNGSSVNIAEGSRPAAAAHGNVGVLKPAAGAQASKRLFFQEDSSVKDSDITGGKENQTFNESAVQLTDAALHSKWDR